MDNGDKQNTRTQPGVIFGMWTAPTKIIITSFGITVECVKYHDSKQRLGKWCENM